MARRTDRTDDRDAVDAGQEIDVSALYRDHWHALVRLSVLLLDNFGEAEDVVQDAFVALQGKTAALRSPDAALAYLRTSVVNAGRSRLRHRRTVRRHLASVGPITPTETHAADHDVIVAAEHSAVVKALQVLPRRQREVLVLRYWSGMSEREIADTLGVSIGTVKSSASRGLDTLETIVGGTF